MKRAYTLRLSAAFALALVIEAACGPGLPSTIPLGGTEKAAATSQRNGSPEPDAGGGEGGALPLPEPTVESSGADDKPVVTDDPRKSDSEAGLKLPGAIPTVSPGLPGDALPGQTADEDCDDSGGSEPTCSALERGACGAVFGRLCRGLQKQVKPKIAQAVVECLAEKNRASSCLSFDECFQLGLALACPTDADRRTCRAALERCGKSTPASPWHSQQRCERALAAFKPEARGRIVDCLEAGCDFDECFTQPERPD